MYYICYMKTLTIALFVLAACSSCQKNYSLDYFNTYQADAPNKVMKKSANYETHLKISVDKIGNDEFEIFITYIDTYNKVRRSQGVFNHKGRMIGFEQLR